MDFNSFLALLGVLCVDLGFHDYLPLIKIVEGSGGVMTDWDGNSLPLDDKDVYVLASASKELHELALEKLKNR